MNKALLIFIWCMICGVASAQTAFYISSSGGSDSNPGTISQPFASPQKAASAGSISSQSDPVTLSFKGGDVFNTNFATSSGFITINSYGTGRATFVETNSDHGILFFDSPGSVLISNINVYGNTNWITANTGFFYDGIQIANTSSGTLDTNFTVADCDVAMWGFGINVTAAKNCYISGASVVGCTVHDIISYAIFPNQQDFDTTPPIQYNLTNVLIAGNITSNIYGLSGENQGFGILLGWTSGFTIIGNVIHDGASRGSGGGGSSILQAFCCTNGLIEFNECYHCVGDDNGGDGIDLDTSTRGVTVQWNYCHDNYGAGLLVFGAWDGIVERFNVCVNNSFNGAGGSSEMEINASAGSVLTNFQMYNNTLITGRSANTVVSAGGFSMYGTNNVIANNILVQPVTSGSDIEKFFDENVVGTLYMNGDLAYSLDGSQPAVMWTASDTGPSYDWTGTGAGTMASLGFELNGIWANPSLYSYSAVTIGTPFGVMGMTNYQPTNTIALRSAAVASALNLLAAYGISNGGFDILSNAVPNNFYNIGAYNNGLLGKPFVNSNANDAALQGSAQWAQLVNLRPYNNETVTVNPPIFSWFYSPPTASGSPTNEAFDTNIYQYVFQADYNGTFGAPAVNVTTFDNFYNFVAPFSLGPVFWRVQYYTNSSNNLTANYGGAGWTLAYAFTNVFSVGSGATNWDRSAAASPSYFTSKTHPYILFNGANGTAISNSVRATDNTDWLTVSNAAVATQSASWYSSPAPWTGSPDYVTRSLDLNYIAFLWMTTTNPTFTNLLVTNFDDLILYYTANQLWNLDYGNGADPNLTYTLPLTYDWIYPLLKPTEKAVAIAAMDDTTRTAVLNGSLFTPRNQTTSWFAEGNNDATLAYTGPYWMPCLAIPKMGDSHLWINQHENFLPFALASFNDSTNSWYELQTLLNYGIRGVTPYGQGAVNQGRSYGYQSTFDYGTVENTLLCGTVFPELKLTNNPVFNRLGDWWNRMIPPGYDQSHEQFGDVQIPGGAVQVWRKITGGRDLAMLTQNGNFIEAQNQLNLWTGANGNTETVEDMVYPYYYATPSATVNSTLGVSYPTEGWTFGSAYAPNTTNCFYSGPGFIMMSRPRGSEAGHSPFSDLDFEIWAYGANVTDGAGGSFVGNHAAFMHNTVQINGLGQAETEAQPMVPVASYIQAFTNAADYVYVAADATQAYPHQAFLPESFLGGNGSDVPNGWLMGEFANPLLTAGPLSYVTAVHREILFMHHQYFVIYDTLTATNAATNIFSWVYHVTPNTISGPITNGTFTYYSPVWGYNGVGASGFNLTSKMETNYVDQVVSSLELSGTNMEGTNAYSNPITKETYWNNVTADGETASYYTNSVWIRNVTPTNQFHFMTVIFPMNPLAAGIGAPTFTNYDDNTVDVSWNGTNDVVSFNPLSPYAGNANVVVDSPSVWTNPPQSNIQPPFLPVCINVRITTP